jgi:hypothetical protein
MAFRKQNAALLAELKTLSLLCEPLYFARLVFQQRKFSSTATVSGLFVPLTFFEY